MTRFTNEDLRRALADCVIPGRRHSVVEAALVQSALVRLDREAPGFGIQGVPERYAAEVVLLAPGTDEAVNAQLQAAVENRLLGLPEISQVTVTMRPTPFPILTVPR